MTCYIAATMPKHKVGDDNLSEFRVGDRVKVNMHRGRIVEAEIKAVIKKTHAVRLQVSFGKETALIYLWQVVEGTVSLGFGFFLNQPEGLQGSFATADTRSSSSSRLY
jgi:hypothetical protein